MKAYDSLADWFESLNDDCDYPKWSQYFIDGLAALGAGRDGLEMGCGSGAFCRALTRSGYTMTGVDSSEAMLSRAAFLAGKEGLSIPFYRGDARTFRARHAYDFILSPNDCMNYLAPEDLPRAFAAAYRNLKKGGIFWFDISSPCKLRGKVANTISADDRDDVTYLAFCTDEGDRVRLEVTLFVREGDVYRRYDETHIEYIHEENAVCSALAEAGFGILRVEGHLGEPKEGSDRLNFLCRKV